MAKPSKQKLARVLIEDYGTLWSEAAGIKLQQGTPSPLFRWLCTSILLSARISGDIALEAARALAKQGWTTPQKLADSTWEQRAKTLNESGYARYDERTSTMLGDAAEMLLEKYRGDLRRLRDQAERDPQKERERLKEFKGIGDVGVDIFFREVQVVWEELLPFADDRALRAAKQFGLGSDAESLARLVKQEEFSHLLAGLVRVDLKKDYDAVRDQAA